MSDKKRIEIIDPEPISVTEVYAKTRARLLGGVILESIHKQLVAPETYGIAVAIGLAQGLRYNEDVKRGVKAGLYTVGFIVGTNVVFNVANNLSVLRRDS